MEAPQQAPPDSIFWLPGLALPVEIQEEICYYLCSYCHDHPGLEGPRHGTRSLAALCRTSQSFAAVAQPHLYHVAHNLTNANSMLRTLSGSTNLARQIRTYNQGKAYGGSRRHDGVDEMLGYALSLGVLGDDKQCGAPLAQNAELSKHLFDQLFLLLATRLENLCLEIGSDHIYEEMYYLLLETRLETVRNGANAAVEAPLSNLRMLSIHTHYDWGYGLGLRTIRPVLRAAASTLEELIVSCCTDFGGDAGSLGQLVMPKLKRIDLNGCAFEHEVGSHLPIIKKLCESTSQLDEFRYRGRSAWIGENLQAHATAVDMFHCVRSCGPSLRTLTIDLKVFSEDLITEPKLMAGSFDTFNCLEVLLLDDFSFCHHMLHASGASLPSSCLTSLLPASIVRLVIHMSEGSPIWADLHDLARAVTQGRFPKLRELHLDMPSDLPGTPEEPDWSHDSWKNLSPEILRQIQLEVASRPALTAEQKRPKREFRAAAEGVRGAFGDRNVAVTWRFGRR